MGATVLMLLVALVAVSALPPTPRLESSDVAAVRAFDPDRQIVYHLFTRANPTVSQPLLHGNDGLLGMTNYDQRKRTVVILHGWLESVTSTISSVLIPAFLAAEDVNIIAVDWSAGASTINFNTAWKNTADAGESVARFINWMNDVTDGTGLSYHLIGAGLGGHMTGIVGRNLITPAAYITALEPSNLGLMSGAEKLRSTDAEYTEVIHTSAGVLGYLGTLGDVDFYPNGGNNMPGCNGQDCDHERSIHYFAESITLGGFKGTKCGTYIGAMTGNCILFGSLNMGGLVPKTGKSGIYYMTTNPAPPFSQK